MNRILTSKTRQLFFKHVRHVSSQARLLKVKPWSKNTLKRSRMNWLVIGISGVTCGGKTTTANQLNKIFPSSKVISQDDYFLPVDDPRHTWIEALNHINFDTLSSLDMEKMFSDIQDIISKKTKTYKLSNSHDCNLSQGELQVYLSKKVTELKLNILIVEGFCILNYKPIAMLCDLKYFFTLGKDECYSRRLTRVYEPPDCPGYFEQCVWPEYLEQYKDIRKKVSDVKFFSENCKEVLREILLDVKHVLNIKS